MGNIKVKITFRTFDFGIFRRALLIPSRIYLPFLEFPIAEVFLLFMVENIRTHLRAFEHPGAGPGLRSNCLVQLVNFACTETNF